MPKYKVEFELDFDSESYVTQNKIHIDAVKSDILNTLDMDCSYLVEDNIKNFKIEVIA